MSRTNCFLPSKGFCLNFRVRMVKSLMVPTGLLTAVGQSREGRFSQDGLSQNGYGFAIP